MSARTVRGQREDFAVVSIVQACEQPEHAFKRRNRRAEQPIALAIDWSRATALWLVHAIVKRFTTIAEFGRCSRPEAVGDDEERLEHDAEHVGDDRERVGDDAEQPGMTRNTRRSIVTPLIVVGADSATNVHKPDDDERDED